MFEIIKKIIFTLRSKGITGLLRAVFFRMRGLSPNQAKCSLEFNILLKDKIGLEVGGPSQVFSRKGVFPVYPTPSRIDNCTYGGETIWEGSIKEGQTFQFDIKKQPGWQFLTEATNLQMISSETYDFVLSSHMLEHTANPILALSEWIRVLKDNGVLILLLPHKDGTFDHQRPVTTIQHLISDFKVGMEENDLTHMQEILTLHDLKLDPEAGDKDSFKARSERNFENRCFHHHVFDTHLAVKLIDHMGLQIQTVETILPLHILIVAQKISTAKLTNNSAYISKSASFIDNSPFPSDHL